MLLTVTGRVRRVSGRGSRRLLAGLAPGALWGAVMLVGVCAGAASGASGGASPSSTSSTSSSTSTAPAPSIPAPPRNVRNPLAGRGMWMWYVSQSSGGSVSSIISTARSYGLSTLLIKSGDGPTYWSQFNSTLVDELHAAGLKVCAWQYLYGDHPIFEAEVGATAVQAGADCLLIDAESEYQGKYVQAQEYVKKLRQLIGANFPLALAGFPYVDYHPSFPYSVFLGPGGAQFDAPQMYWHDIGVSVDEVYNHTYSYNLPYGRPIEPLGEVAGNPAPGQVIRFRQLSRAYFAGGVSWWDWQESSARDWKALDQPAGSLTGFTPQATFPTLSLRGAGGIWAGDLVVWAQEHLLRAGYTATIDGDFATQTQVAVESFQTAHGLPVTGIVDPATWQALLRYPAPPVTWSKHKGKSTASAARAALILAPPWSSHLKARGYEIPPHLGAGRWPDHAF